jgi:hypothetical protein
MKKHYDIIKKIIKDRNLIPKAVSLLLAIVLWLYVSKEKLKEISIKVPITFTGLEDNYIVSGISSKEATAKIRAHKDVIKDISSKNIKLTVDLTGAKSNDYKTFPIECHKIDYAGNYEVTSDPENVEILIEKKITREVKVVPDFKGTTKSGFMLGQVNISPEFIKIEGPSSIVNNIGVIHTENIIIDDKSAAFSSDIKIHKVYKDNINYSLSRVNVTVPVINYSKTEFIELPVVMKNKKPGYNYLLISDKIKIQIIKNDNENIAENSFSSFIDCDEIKINNEEFITKSKITAIGFVHIIADTLKNKNRILSSAPVTVEIVVTSK